MKTTIQEFIDVANACEEYYCLNTKFIQSEISDYVLSHFILQVVSQTICFINFMFIIMFNFL